MEVNNFPFFIFKNHFSLLNPHTKMTFFALVDDVSSAVIDIGSEETRAGYSGEDTPRCVLPSYVGLVPPN